VTRATRLARAFALVLGLSVCSLAAAQSVPPPGENTPFPASTAMPPLLRATSAEESAQLQRLVERLPQLQAAKDLDGIRRDNAAALALLDASFGPAHPLRARVAGVYAYNLYHAGAIDEAAAQYETALTALEAALSQFHPEVSEAAAGYAEVLLAKDVPFGKWQSHPSLYWLLTRALAPAQTGESVGDANWLEATALVADALEADEQAEERRRKVLAMRLKLSSADELGIASARGRLAHTLAELGRVDEAEALANQALSTWQARPDAARQPAIATATLALAKARLLRGRPAEAEPLFRRAVQVREQTLGPKHALTLDARADLARFLAAQGRAPEAAALLGPIAAQLVAERMGGPRMMRVMLDIADTLDKPAECAQGASQLEGMRDAYFAQLFVTAKQRMRMRESGGRLRACAGQYAQAATELVAAEHEFLMAQDYRNSAEFGLANARYALWLAGHSEAAEAASRFASMGVSIARSRQRQGFANSDAPSFGNAVDRAVHSTGGGNPLALAYEAELAVDWPAYAQGQSWGLHQAFRSAQELSVSGAAIAMAQTRARTAAGSGALAALVARQQQLSAQAVALDREAVAAVARNEAAASQAARAQLKPLADELEAIDARLQQEFPAYAGMVSPQALKLPELQARLRPDEGLLLLVPVREHVHVFGVSKNSAKWHRLDNGAAGTAQKIARLRCQVDPATCGGAGASDGRGVQSVYGTAVAQGGKAFDRDAAYALYHDLVEPVEGALAGVKRVYVTAAGELGKLPLGVLVTSAPAAGEDDADPAVLARTPWLADRYALLTLPAVSALNAPVPAPPAGNGFLGFGSPSLLGNAGSARSASGAKLFAEAAGDGAALANVDAIRHLAPLPGTQVELQAMAQLYGGQSSLALGNEATEAKLKSSAALGQAQVVAFATHGLLPREVRGMDEPGLVFTPPAKASAQDDGVLTASEASKLSLSAEWIILSACNTAAADGSSGAQSLSGLARAFLYAGAQALLASHWRVSDDATAALTTETLSARRASASVTRAQALQAAMHAVRTGQRDDGSALSGWKPAWSHPAAWAPFVLISDRD
jgi:CHAT domain-containing protein